MTLKRILRTLNAHGFILNKINADLNFEFTEEDLDRAVRRWSISDITVSAIFDLPIALLAIRLLLLRENIIILGSLIAVLIVLYAIARFKITKIFPAKLLLKIYNERSLLIKNAINNSPSSNNKDKES